MFRNFVVIVALITILTGCSGKSISNGIAVLSGVAVAGTIGYIFLETVEEAESYKEKKQLEKQLIVEEIKEANVGRHISEVIQRIGPPQNITDDYTGGKIFIWTNEKQFSVPQYDYVPALQNNKPLEEPFIPQIDPLKSPLKLEKSETQGEMWYNPYLDRYEWKSKTRNSSGDSLVSSVHSDAINKMRENARSDSSNAFVKGLKSQKKVVTGHVTRHKVESIMFFVKSDGTVYNVLYKDW